MWFMFDLAIEKKMINKYEEFYKDHQGKDINYMITENNNLRQLINDLQGNIMEKNKDIIKLKVTVVDLNQMIIEKDNEIT